MIFCGGFVFSQNNYDYYPTSYDNGYYSDSEDSFYFPDDYYYEYPADYYTDDLYYNYYNDYQRSITDINWNRFFAQNRLSAWQIQQVIYLNQAFPTFEAWNSYYRYNPDRWYYDRFYALQQILGPNAFVAFQNVYYNGYSPFVYYRNYRIKHYAPIVYVVPRYRNVNINIYRIDRHQYHRNHGWSYNPREGYGFRNTPGNSGFRNQNGFRNNEGRNNTPRLEGNSGNRNSPTRDFKTSENPTRNNNSGGFRNTPERTPKVQPGNRSFEKRTAPNNSGRSSGQRLVSR